MKLNPKIYMKFLTDIEMEDSDTEYLRKAYERSAMFKKKSMNGKNGRLKKIKEKRKLKKFET